MLRLTKILLPVDFSERCLGAARHAEALAAHFNAEICVLHVLEPVRAQLSTLECGGAVIDNLRESLEAGARNNLRTFLAEELKNARVSRYLVEGDPAAKIVQYAHDERVDLIAMPTHGYGPFRRFILGSVAAKVLHDADCPVWTGVHLEQAPAGHPIEFKSVVCAVDLGPQSRKALCWAAQMAREFGARLFGRLRTNAYAVIRESPCPVVSV